MKPNDNISHVLQDEPIMLGCVMTPRTIKPINFGLFVAALLGMTSHAGLANEPNVFNADLTHPDLALAVSAFEETCMPFVLHETEMDREHDKLHMAKLMQSRGFDLRSSAQESKTILIEPKRGPWKPASDDRERFKHIYAHNEKQNGKPKTTFGQFTIFNGTSMEVITADNATKPPLNGEIWGPVQIPAKYKRILIETETYRDLNEPRLTAEIKWNYASQKDPGEQCKTTLRNTTVTQMDFIESFINKDIDWIDSSNSQLDNKSWYQCIKEGENHFRFDASLAQNTLQLSMRRSDFYETKFCGANKIHANETTHAQ